MSVSSYLRLIALAALWGGAFLFLRIGAPVFGPALLIELRVAIAAGFIWLAYRVMHQPIVLAGHWRRFFILGALTTALPFLLFAYAAQSITASLLAIINASSPIFGALVAWLWLRERPTVYVMLGMALGLSGVGVLVGGRAGITGEASPLAFAAATLAPLCYGIASVYAKRTMTDVAPAANALGSQSASALMVLPLALLMPPLATPTPLHWLAVAIMGVFCTGLAYLLYFRLIRDVGPMRALSVTYLIPVFGVLWGGLILGETLEWNMLAGGLMILPGTALATGMLPWQRPRPPGTP